MLGHNNIQNYLQTMFAMVQHHKWSLTELENMMPWEYEVYVTMLIRHIEEQERIAQEQQQRR